MNALLEIACDEAGHTGPDLLHRDQRHFAYGSVSVSDAEAYEIIAKARADNAVQMPELKASKLLKSENGRKLIEAILVAVEGRYAFNVHDKLLALCGWFFEYIYEPVYQDNPRLLYEKNLHRFVAMYAWLWMSDETSEAGRAVREFQAYMRSRDPNDAPFLFGTPRAPLSDTGSEHPFESVLRFAQGYRDRIVADNANLDKVLPDQARWTLDLSASALWSHLNYWGSRNKPLSVNCDASKPLQAIISGFTGDHTDPGIRRARDNGHTGSLGWKLSRPIAFCDSRSHPAVQLADVIAGTGVALASYALPKGPGVIVESMLRHALADSILPDMDIVDPSTRPAAVNALILFDLAKRAERGGDPYFGLAEMYRQAEISWVKGDYSLSARPPGPQR